MALAISSVVLGSITGLSVATNITNTLVISSITGTYGLVRGFATYHYTQVNEVIEECDLTAKLEIIEALMYDVSKKDSTDKESIKKAFNNLDIVVTDINKLLQKIDLIIKAHKDKYFSNWRTLCYDKEIYELKRLIRLMDLRYAMFLEILKIK